MEELGGSTYLRYSNPVFLHGVGDGFVTNTHTLCDLLPIIFVLLNKNTDICNFLLLLLLLFNKERYIPPQRTKRRVQSSDWSNGTVRPAAR